MTFARQRKATMTTIDINNYQLPDGKVLVLRVIHANRESSRGFYWPEVGKTAIAPDWNPEPICGYGLHGWLWAQGDVDASGSEWGFAEKDAIWLVLEVDASSVVSIDNGEKIKFPKAQVLFEGTASACTEI